MRVGRFATQLGFSLVGVFVLTSFSTSPALAQDHDAHMMAPQQQLPLIMKHPPPENRRETAGNIAASPRAPVSRCCEGGVRLSRLRRR